MRRADVHMVFGLLCLILAKLDHGWWITIWNVSGAVFCVISVLWRAFVKED